MSTKINEYSLFDIARKLIYVLLRYFIWAIRLLRKFRFFFFTKAWIKNILGAVHINTVCIHVKIGKNATLYPCTIFEVGPNARLNIGNNFTLSYGGLIACNYSVKIGDDVMIGEYSSIRDTTHTYTNLSVNYGGQPDHSEEIVIGNNVWIGRGTIIFPGTVIEDGVIVGANSLVKGRLLTNCIYAGSPLNLIKQLVNGSDSISETVFEKDKNVLL